MVSTVCEQAILLLDQAYLIHDIFERVRAVDGEADEEQVGLRVREWSQSVVLFLAGSIPEGKLDGLTA